MKKTLYILILLLYGLVATAATRTDNMGDLFSVSLKKNPNPICVEWNAHSFFTIHVEAHTQECNADNVVEYLTTYIYRNQPQPKPGMEQDILNITVCGIDSVEQKSPFIGTVRLKTTPYESDKTRRFEFFYGHDSEILAIVQFGRYSLQPHTLKGGGYLPPNAKVTLTLDGSNERVTYRLTRNGKTYDEKTGTGKPLSFEAEHTGIYTVTAVNGNGTMPMKGMAQVHRYNPEYTCRVDTFFTGEKGETFRTSVEYADRWGRPFIRQEVNASPTDSMDLISAVTYALGGKAEREYLPYPAASTQGDIHRDAFDKGKRSCYGEEEDETAFTLNTTEDSPLMRNVLTIGPGKDWHRNSKGVRTEYGRNNGGEVRRFRVDRQGKLIAQGYYPEGALEKTVTTGEDGHCTVTFTDARQREVMSASLTENDSLRTYHVYDNRGKLRYILSPEAAERMTDTPDEGMLKKLAFYYEYDDLGRMTLKRMPGSEPICLVYDRKNRLVMSRDGNEKNADPRKWTYTLYDRADRMTENGTVILETGMTHEELMEEAASREEYMPEGKRTPRQRMLYDSYREKEESGIRPFRRTEGFAAGYNHCPNGLCTAVMTRVEGTEKWITQTNYYNHRAEPVQLLTDSIAGSVHVTDRTYGLGGDVLKERQEHGNNVAVTGYSYDRMQRTVAQESSLNGGETAKVEYRYDALGRLCGKSYGTVRESMEYNPRGWLTEKQSGPFGLKLIYEKAMHGATPCYNGNMAGCFWRHGNEDMQGYLYEYDLMGRMTAAAHRREDGTEGGFEENGISYDRNGNILTLRRTAHGKTVDNLKYHYDGNRLERLDEKVREVSRGDVYEPGKEETGYYDYDFNGNMIKDSGKNLKFNYNHLNLVSDVWLDDSLMVQYSYLADGTKIAVRDGSGMNGYDYVGCFVYRVENGKRTLEKALCGDIHLEKDKALYAITDHLGSVRVLCDAEGKVEQRNDFYPFGARMENRENRDNGNRFLFSGKERQSMYSENTYDFGARMYDAAIARWNSPDPKAEKYNAWSPYNYCANNPVVLVDPDGTRLLLCGNILEMMAVLYNGLGKHSNATIRLVNGFVDPASLRIEAIKNATNPFLQDLYEIASDPRIVELYFSRSNHYKKNGKEKTDKFLLISKYTIEEDLEFLKNNNCVYSMDRVEKLYEENHSLSGNFGQALFPNVKLASEKESTNGNVQIIINANGNLNERTVGLAHEFGHIVLYLRGKPFSHDEDGVNNFTDSRIEFMERTLGLKYER